MAEPIEQQTESKTRRLVVHVTNELYDQFSACKLRRECNTDSEGVRAALKKAIELDGVCQEKNQDGKDGRDR